MSVYQSCCDKVSQTRWLKTMEMSSLIILEARSLQARCWQGQAPSEGPRGGYFLASPSFRKPQTVLGLWQPNSNFCHPLHMAVSLYLCPNFPLGAPVILELGPTLMTSSQLDYICKKKVTFPGAGFRTPTYLFRGQDLTHNIEVQ